MQEIIKKAEELAIEEIKKFNIPKMEHFVLANKQGQKLAEELGADKDIVLLGTMLMDLKIGQCMKEGRLEEHVKESSAASKNFLEQFNLDAPTFNKIISCIESHHGVDKYDCLEAEICANADCYRFLSPEGFCHSLLIFGNRFENLDDGLSKVEAKLDEKYNILSLDSCKKDLDEYYHCFKKIVKNARTK